MLTDEEFCEQLLKDYQNDPDPHKTDTIPLEQLARELGMELLKIRKRTVVRFERQSFFMQNYSMISFRRRVLR